MYLKKIKIGNVELDNNLILAPMAGVTDLPFRLLCKEQGAGLLCMEMVSAKAILYKNRNTQALLTIDPRENPVSLQLFGSDPDIIAEIAHQIEDRPFDILDLNMGCPVPKIVNNGEGSALMKNPKLAPRGSFRRRQKALEAEGHRSCPSGFNQIPPVDARRRCIRSQAPRLSHEPQQEAQEGCT